MSGTLTSMRYPVDDLAEALELPHRNGWSDGLPVVPPTESRVAEFLDSVGLAPDQVIGEVPERARAITAEKLAINAVMAGCLPEYMPVLVAAVEAVTDPQFKFNHLASLGSPWPLIIINGPITREIGLNSGMYIFGPGHRPNLTIARALSLVLRNCAEAKVEGVQRGKWGNPNRFVGCIAENEETPWTPLHVQRGLDRNDSAVTLVSTYPGVPQHTTMLMLGERPERMLDPVCHSLASYGGALWTRGVFTLLMGPADVEVFVKKGWSKEDVRNYVVENTKSSVAELKYRGVWGMGLDEMSEEMHQIQPGDEKTFLYLFKDNGELDRYVYTRSNLEGRLVDLFVVVAGGNAGWRPALTFPYQYSTNPVTKKIRSK